MVAAKIDRGEWLTLEQVLEVCSRFDVSERQLKDWRKHRLIVRPIRVPLASGRGTVSLYAPDTPNRIDAIQFCLSQNRNVELAYFRLWLDGFRMPVGRIRRILRSRVERLGPEDTEDGGMAFAERIYTQHRRAVGVCAATKFVRNRVSHSDTATAVVHLFLSLLGGGSPDVSVETGVGTLSEVSATMLQDISIRAGGIEFRMPLGEDCDRALRSLATADLAGIFENLESVLRYSPAELEGLRRTTVFVVAHWYSISSAAKSMLPEDAFDVLDSIDPVRDPSRQPLLLIGLAGLATALEVDLSTFGRAPDEIK